MGKKNAIKIRKLRDITDKSENRLSREINKNIEETMVGRAQTNKIHLGVVKSMSQVSLAAKKAKQQQKAQNLKMKKLLEQVELLWSTN